jgi:isoleucyl-tRNA synthetase
VAGHRKAAVLLDSPVVTGDQRTELPPQYQPAQVEGRRYEEWVARGYFSPDTGGAKRGGPPYCIVIPPPNVTGSLHMGHALDHTATAWTGTASDSRWTRA